MSEEKLLSLTFDDGPNTTCTKAVLDLLEEFGTVGSFFVVGQNITEESAAMMQRASDMGCEIHNHSYTHSYMDKLTVGQIRDEIARTTELIVKYTGRQPEFFRPPYIVVDQKMRDSIDFPFICGRGCEDWVPTVPAEERARMMLENVCDGDIFLLHDMEHNEATVEALKTVIPKLLKQGFRFVNISELFKIKGITPRKGSSGIIYSNCFQTL